MVEALELECTTQEDEIFKIALQMYWQDLHIIVMITNDHPRNRTERDIELLDYFKEVYQLNGPCSSTFFEHVSPTLQNNYWTIHNQICARLYR